MYETTIQDLKVGQTVRAFHPGTLGVIHTGEIVKIGRKYATIRFPFYGPRTWRIAPQYVTEIV